MGRSLRRIFFVGAWLAYVALLSSSAAAAEVESLYKGRFGLRLGADVAVFGSYIDSQANADKPHPQQADPYLNRFGSGWFVPLQLEGTYSITNALEVLLGLRYAFSSPLGGTTDPYVLSSIGVSLGYRYYVNVREPVKFYFSGQLATAFLLPTIDTRMEFGLLWDVHEHVGIFLQSGVGGAAILSTPTGAGLGGQAYGSLGLGAHGRF